MLTRITEWWTRSFWGWMVVLGPMACYVALLVSLDVVGLGAANELQSPIYDAETAFKPADQLLLYSIAGRLEYAIVSSVFFLVATFSIFWSVPKILVAIRNPFGGMTGLILSLGSSAALYYLYWISEYNLRQIFADDILRLGEQAGLLIPVTMDVAIFGITFFKAPMQASEILGLTRDVVYFVGNAAPWCLIVLAATCVAYEPRRFRSEPPEKLKKRLSTLQIAVLLAAANIVLSVWFTRSMTSWPPMLLNEELGRHFSAATSRYIGLWGVLGSALLIAALTPAVISLFAQFDRIAMRELGADQGRKVTYEERMNWRRKHGLVFSTQQILTTGAAVLAPMLSSPALDAQNRDSERDRSGYVQTDDRR